MHGPTEVPLGNLLTRYYAIRTLRGVKTIGLTPIVRALKSAIASRTIDPVALVNDVNQRIYSVYADRNCISAVSKALWMIFRHPIAIYDNRASDGLRAMGRHFKHGDYSIFYESWNNYFNQQSTKEKISLACEWLVQSSFAANLERHGVANSEEIRLWADSDWFRNRVLDFRLMQAGTDPLHPADVALFLGPDA